MLLLSGAWASLAAQMPTGLQDSYTVWEEGERLNVELKSLSCNTNGEEHSPSYYRDGILYSSAPVSVSAKKTKVADADIYYQSFVDGTIQNEAIKLRGEMRSKLSEGGTSITKDGRHLIFTQKTADGTERAGTNNLWVVTTENGLHFQDKRAFRFNSEHFQIQDPHLSADNTVFYFVSDMPDGYGGLDIYKCENLNGEWSNPINLGPSINTEGDEKAPFLLDDVLFFSSNGHPGFGGFDIFVTKSYRSEWMPAVNLPASINTDKNEHSFLYDPLSAQGFLVSQSELGDSDIYSFSIVESTEAEEEVEPMLSQKSTPSSLQEAYKPVVPKTNWKDRWPGAAGPTYVEEEVQQPEVQDETAYHIRPQKNFAKSMPNQLPTETIVDEKTNATIVMTASKNSQSYILNESIGIGKINFRDKDANITSAAAKDLNRLAVFLKQYPHVQVELAAHTNVLGDAFQNEQITKERASLARAQLISKGVRPEQIVANGYGERQPLNYCKEGMSCPDELHAKNDRIEVRSLVGNVAELAIPSQWQPEAEVILVTSKSDNSVAADMPPIYFKVDMGPFGDVANEVYAECLRLDTRVQMYPSDYGTLIVLGPYATASEARQYQRKASALGIDQVKVTLVNKGMKEKVELVQPRKEPLELYVGPFQHMSRDTYNKYLRFNEMGENQLAYTREGGVMLKLSDHDSLGSLKEAATRLSIALDNGSKKKKTDPRPLLKTRYQGSDMVKEWKKGEWVESTFDF